jgi:hypothetical protein
LHRRAGYRHLHELNVRDLSVARQKLSARIGKVTAHFTRWGAADAL